MRHNVSGYKLGRSKGHRNAMRRNLATELLRHERIRTTKAKAQSIRGYVDKLITSAKHGNSASEGSPSSSVHARRMAAAKIGDPEIVQKLFDDIALRFEDRSGGYTRMIKLGRRRGDGAEIVLLELVEE